MVPLAAAVFRRPEKRKAKLYFVPSGPVSSKPKGLPKRPLDLTGKLTKWSGDRQEPSGVHFAHQVVMTSLTRVCCVLRRMMNGSSWLVAPPKMTPGCRVALQP